MAYVGAAMWLLFLAVGFSIVASLGPLVDGALSPVIETVGAVADRQGDDVTFSVTIDKYRECRIDHFGWQAEAQAEAQAQAQAPKFRTNLDVSNKVKVMAPATNATAYPTGRAILGPFFTHLPMDYDRGVKIWSDVFYSCPYRLWLIHQVFGPVAVPDAVP